MSSPIVSTWTWQTLSIKDFDKILIKVMSSSQQPVFWIAMFLVGLPIVLFEAILLSMALVWELGILHGCVAGAWVWLLIIMSSTCGFAFFGVLQSYKNKAEKTVD